MNNFTDVEYLRSIVVGIAEHADAIFIERRIDDMGVLLSLTVHKADTGRIIGREGMTINAIRQLVRVFGMITNARINLKVINQF